MLTLEGEDALVSDGAVQVPRLVWWKESFSFHVFLRLGVFEAATPEWAGQTGAPTSVPAGCEYFTGEGGVWKERKTTGEFVGPSVGGCLFAQLA